MAVPTLVETYKLLGLKEPLAWERAVREVNAVEGHELQRGTGTTTRLGVEAALDILKDKTIWLIGYTVTDIARLREVIDKTLSTLNAPYKAGAGKVFSTTWEDYNGAKVKLIGTRPDAVYIDHYLGPNGKDHRPASGPYGMIRTIAQNNLSPKVWDAKDYDGTLVMSLDHEAACALCDLRPERVRLIPIASPSKMLDLTGVNVTGSSWHHPVKAVSTTDVPLVNHMVTDTETDFFDGAAIEVGDTVLLTGQQDTSQNGVYEIFGGGTDGMLYLAAEPSPGDGTSLLVTEGVLYADTTWVYDGPDWLQLSSTGGGTPFLQSAYADPNATTLVVTGDLSIGTTSGGSLSLASTQVSDWAEENGDKMKRVVLPDGAVMLYRNGLLEEVEGAEVVGYDPDDPSLLINILADED
ncbi:hypothetical protein N9917_00110 [Deltaproteobacteria bacterium]|nr:hypothetical protein [Deltaproteobacteria bacterium]